MADEVFIDSSAWCALFFAGDSNHRRAKGLWMAIRDNKWPLCTTNWTLYEAATVLACRLGRHDWAVRLLQLAKETATVLQAERVEQEAVGTFVTHADKTWSVVDCASFHYIRDRECRRAFAFDEHFRQAQEEFGFVVLS